MIRSLYQKKIVFFLTAPFSGIACLVFSFLQKFHWKKHTVPNNSVTSSSNKSDHLLFILVKTSSTLLSPSLKLVLSYSINSSSKVPTVLKNFIYNNHKVKKTQSNSSINFCVCIYSCNHHSGHSIEHYQHPWRLHSYLFLSTLPQKSHSDFHCHRLLLPVPEHHINGNMLCILAFVYKIHQCFWVK